MTSPTIEELIGRLEGAYSTVFERSLAKEAALALRELVQERDANKNMRQYAETSRESELAILHSLTQHKDWLREALEMLEVCRGNCDLYFSAYGSLTFDVEDQRQIAQFVDEFLAQIRKPMEGE